MQCRSMLNTKHAEKSYGSWLHVKSITSEYESYDKLTQCNAFLAVAFVPPKRFM